MNKTTPKRQKKVICPHCGNTFQRPQALAGHIRYKHPNKLPSKTAPSTVKEQKKVGAEVTQVAGSAPVIAPNTGAHEHLKKALEELTQRIDQIEGELSRMEPLRAENRDNPEANRGLEFGSADLRRLSRDRRPAGNY